MNEMVTLRMTKEEYDLFLQNLANKVDADWMCTFENKRCEEVSSCEDCIKERLNKYIVD